MFLLDLDDLNERKKNYFYSLVLWIFLFFRDYLWFFRLLLIGYDFLELLIFTVIYIYFYC